MKRTTVKDLEEALYKMESIQDERMNRLSKQVYQNLAELKEVGYEVYDLKYPKKEKKELSAKTKTNLVFSGIVTAIIGYLYGMYSLLAYHVQSIDRIIEHMVVGIIFTGVVVMGGVLLYNFIKGKFEGYWVNSNA